MKTRGENGRGTMQIPNFAWKLLGVGAGAFAVTFTIYFFNLDMKLLSAFEPILLRHYDRIPRNQHL